MADTRVIQVPLPAGVEPTGEDLELLDAACRAIVDVRFAHGGEGASETRNLEAEGWIVSSRLMWVAEARKGREREQACGRTRQEALEQLHELAKIDDVARVP